MRLFGQLSELVKVLFRKNSNEITIEPGTNTGLSGDVSFTLPEESGPSSHELTTNDSTQSLTNKSIEASQIDSGTLPDARIAETGVTQHEAAIDHDALTNYTAAEHIDWASAGAEDIDDGRIPSSAVTQHVGDIDHDSLLNTHNLTTDIDHDTITNGHNLTTDIDHDTITNGHNLTADIDHDTIQNGSNSSGVHGVVGDVVGTSDTQELTNKDINGGTASDDNRVTLPSDTKANLDGLTRKAGTVVYATDNEIVYLDDGSDLLPIGSEPKESATLTASTTDNVFTATASGNENWIIKYSLKESSTNYKRIGQLFITTDGTTVSISDTSTEIADLGVTFSADISGSDIRLRYTVDGANNVAMQYFAKSWSD